MTGNAKTVARSVSRVLPTATLVLITVVLAACGDEGGDPGDDGAGAGSTATQDETTTTEEDTTATDAPAEAAITTALAPEDQAWTDLLAAIEVVRTLSTTPDPDAPELVRHFTGESLQGIQDTMRDLQAGGGSQSTYRPHRYSVSIVGEGGTIEYCYAATTQHLDTAGNPVGGVEETSRRGTAQVQLIDGVWKIAQQSFTSEACPS